MVFLGLLMMINTNFRLIAPLFGGLRLKTKIKTKLNVQKSVYGKK